MNALEEVKIGLARATVSLDGDGLARVNVTGVLSRITELQRWILQSCEDLQARGCVVDFRRAAMLVDWADHARDNAEPIKGMRMLPVAMVANPALLEEMQDWAWHRAKQGHMRGVFPDAVSATTWALAHAWVETL